MPKDRILAKDLLQLKDKEIKNPKAGTKFQDYDMRNLMDTFKKKRNTRKKIMGAKVVY